MPVPKQRHTKSRRNRRRSHQALKRLNLVLCPKCSQSILPHRVCPNCGTYAGYEVIDVLKKLTKKERKARQKEMAVKEKEAKTLDAEALSKK